MTNLLAIFITGLTTGGLSCLAVQGGLLASAVVHQTEEDMKEEIVKKTEHQEKKYSAQPIILFLVSKLAAYTALGFLLGALGSVIQLTPIMRGLLQLAIGIFMIGTALRMVNAHPVFRHFTIEPPRFITRYIRRVAKNSKGDVVTPLFLGALTVLIPCGITQGMMALAVGSGNPGIGAAIMFAFVLGTSPVFFILSYLATKLGEAMQERFFKVAAIAVLILGLVSLEGGLNLVGSPVSYAAIKDSFASRSALEASSVASTPIAEIAPSGQASVVNTVMITADSDGYAPKISQAVAGQPITLVITSKDLYTCAQAFTIPKLGIQKSLGANGTTTIQLPAQPKGILTYTCSMGMYRGQISIN